MIVESSARFAKACLFSLDHDLAALAREANPGTGLDVAEFLSLHAPMCPVILHTSNFDGRMTDTVSGRYSHSEKAAVQISSDPGQLVVLQDKLDGLSRTGPLPPSCPGGPRSLDVSPGDLGNFSYQVGAGVVGYHVGNNVPASTDLSENNPGGLIDHASLWLHFTTTNAGVLEVDTGGSRIDNLFAVYAYGPGVKHDNLASHLSGWATNGANASWYNRVQVSSGKAGSQFLALAAALHERGAIEINWASGAAPQETNAVEGLPAVTRAEVGTDFMLSLGEAAVTNAQPPSQYWWYRDGVLVGQTTEPHYAVVGLTPEAVAGAQAPEPEPDRPAADTPHGVPHSRLPRPTHQRIKRLPPVRFCSGNSSFSYCCRFDVDAFWRLRRKELQIRRCFVNLRDPAAFRVLSENLRFRTRSQ
jgi:hypothetical protein